MPFKLDHLRRVVYSPPRTDATPDRPRPRRPSRVQPVAQEREFFVGLDLGQEHDFTALAVVERTSTGLDVPFLSRTRGQPYPKIVQVVCDLLAQPPLASASRLVIDATGVGRPVLDLFRAARLDPLAITITGGDRASGNWRNSRVPKRDLMKALLLVLQTGSLKVAAELEHAPTLARELADLRVKISAAGRDSYGVWREGEHDDLVLALAMAVWAAEKMPRGNAQMIHMNIIGIRSLF